MRNLIIEATSTSPNVNFNTETKKFVISGESRPENVREFYDPILAYLDEYLVELISKNIQEPLTFEFKLEYFNSSSAKYILNTLKKLSEFIGKGFKLIINWHYEEGDDDMKEVGEEMSGMLKIPFNYIEVG
jgi:hypothetical protein